MKHKVGKFFNILNPNHRHDEEHEQECDKKRTAIAESHRFNSFAPIRDNNKVKWYVDALDYMWAVSIALEQAEKVIYIEDWWLSPELFLRRPPYMAQEWRLDQVLKRRAEAGVKIYVIVYKEVGCDLILFFISFYIFFNADLSRSTKRSHAIPLIPSMRCATFVPRVPRGMETSRFSVIRTITSLRMRPMWSFTGSV